MPGRRSASTRTSRPGLRPFSDSILPIPIRSEGRKLQLGALVRCTYEGGDLVKRITAVEAPRLLRFEVLEQHLGIEHCLSLGDGSYEIRESGSSSRVFLTTGTGDTCVRVSSGALWSASWPTRFTGTSSGASGIAVPSLWLIRGAIALVWLYEGLWCKVLGRMPSQERIVEAVPWLGPAWAPRVLKALGLVECGMAVWVLSGWEPVWAAAAQTALLVAMNGNGLLFARRFIHDPGGMVVKNAALVVLMWVAAAQGSR